MVVGIDFSLTCPCLCLFNGTEFLFSSCEFYYLTDIKKHQHPTGQFKGFPHKIFSSQEERFDNLSEFIIDKIPKGAKVFIEGFSFGSRAGMMFDIAGATYILRYKMYKKGIDFKIVPPTVVKKLCTGKGNSSKVPMYEAFYKETGVNLLEELNIKTAGISPQSDIVDSFYITKYGYNQTKYR